MTSTPTTAPPVNVNRVLALVFLTLFIDMLGIGLLIPVITPLLLKNPTLFAEGTTAETRTLTYGLLQTAFSLATFLSAPILGLWSDQIGRRRGLIYSISAGVLGYIVFLAGINSASLPLLFLGRIIPGIAAGNLTMAFAAIADVSNNQTRAKNFALIGMAFGLAMVLGPPAGAWLSSSHALSWFNETTPFYVGTLLALINLVLVVLFFQETLKAPRTVSLNLLQAAKNVGTAFTHPRLRGLFLVSLLASFGFNAFTGFLQLYLIRHYDIGNAFFGQLMAFVGICLIATQGFLFRFLLRFFPASKLGVLAMFLLGPAVWATLLTAVATHQYWVVPLIAIGQGISSPSLAATISGRADPRIQGEILGLNNSMLALGLTLTLLVGGFTASWNPAAPLVTAGASILLAAIVFARESWNEPVQAQVAVPVVPAEVEA
jgi:MFS transporter, DHA1 family, tetracycline resistance protein